MFLKRKKHYCEDGLVVGKCSLRLGCSEAEVLLGVGSDQRAHLKAMPAFNPQYLWQSHQWERTGYTGAEHQGPNSTIPKSMIWAVLDLTAEPGDIPEWRES